MKKKNNNNKESIGQRDFWLGCLQAWTQKKNSPTMIKLPNGWLDEYDQLPSCGGSVRTLLEGQLICLMCQNRYAARVMIQNILSEPVLGVSSISCPDCNSPILNLGTDNGRAMLVRLKPKK